MLIRVGKHDIFAVHKTAMLVLTHDVSTKGVTIHYADPHSQFRLVDAREALPDGTVLADRRKETDGRWEGGFEIRIEGKTMKGPRWSVWLPSLEPGVYRVESNSIELLPPRPSQERMVEREQVITVPSTAPVSA